MSYENIKTTGKIVKIDPIHIDDKANNNLLIFPDQLYTTRIEIENNTKGSNSVEVYCALPVEYLNKKAKLLQSYYNDQQRDVSIYIQQLYIDKKLVMNQAVIKKRR